MVSAWILAFVLTSTSHAQVTHLSTTTGSTNTASTITIEHTTAASTNRLMLVGVSDIGTNPAINSVTYGGVALTPLGTAQALTTHRTRIYSLTGPVSGTANVVVTFAGNATNGAIAFVSTYSGVS